MNKELVDYLTSTYQTNQNKERGDFKLKQSYGSLLFYKIY